MSFFEDESFDAVIDKGMALNLCYLFIYLFLSCGH